MLAFAAVLAVLPFGWILLHGPDFTALANESLAYRYFTVLRIARGDGSGVWLPQGFFTSSIQHVILGLIESVSRTPDTDLRTRLNLFALGTIGVNVLTVVLVLLAAALDKAIDRNAAIWIALVALMPVFGFGTSGFLLSILPDYYAMDTALAACAVYLFAKLWRRQTPSQGICYAAVVGCFSGVALASKISMAAIVFFPALAACLVSPITARFLVLRSLVVISTSLLSLFSVVSAFYLFNLDAPIAAFHKWLAFVAAPGSEPSFWQRAPSLAAAMNLHIIGPLFAAVVCTNLALTLGTANAKWRNILVLALATLAGLLAVFAVYRRPAETTLFDAATFLLALTAITCITSAGIKFARSVSALSAILLIGVTVLSFDRRVAFEILEGSAFHGTQAWKLHTEIFEWARGRQVFFVLPDDSYRAETVEELLLKGASEFPRWRVAEAGQWILDTYAPRLQFRNDYERPYVSAPYPGNAILVWIDRLDFLPLRERYPSLAEATGRPGVECRAWEIQSGQRKITHVVRACEAPPMPLLPPSDLQAIRKSGGTVMELSWTPAFPAEAYRIEISRDQSPFQALGRVTWPENVYRIGDLSPIASYAFRVTSLSGDTSSEPSQMVVAAAQPIGPTDQLSR